MLKPRIGFSRDNEPFDNFPTNKQNNIFKFEKNNDEEGPFSSKNRRFDPLSFTNKLANMK